MPEGQAKTVRVALIDDQLLVRHALSALLEERGLASVVASHTHGDRALDGLGAKGADAVIIGFDAQVHDPIETVSKLRRDFPELPICALLGTGEPARVQGALSAGCSGVLSAGASLEMMVSAIDYLIEGQAYVDPNLGGPLLMAGLWRGNHRQRPKQKE